MHAPAIMMWMDRVPDFPCTNATVWSVGKACSCTMHVILPSPSVDCQLVTSDVVTLLPTCQGRGHAALRSLMDATSWTAPACCHHRQGSLQPMHCMAQPASWPRIWSLVGHSLAKHTPPDSCIDSGTPVYQQPWAAVGQPTSPGTSRPPPSLTPSLPK